jgi:hypothetical protein
VGKRKINGICEGKDEENCNDPSIASVDCALFTTLPLQKKNRKLFSVAFLFLASKSHLRSQQLSRQIIAIALEV